MQAACMHQIFWTTVTHACTLPVFARYFG
jgi:hypothetical protein